MKKLTVYIHTEGSSSLKTAEIDPTESLIQALKNGDVFIEDDHYIFFAEEEGGPKGKHEKCDTLGVKDKHHIHCHRCKDVKVSIEYNAEVLELEVAPSSTGANLMRKAGHKFNISIEDMKELRLKVSDDLFINPVDHIGSFVSYPACHIKLFLVPKKLVQG